MIVTTAHKARQRLIDEAIKISNDLQVPFSPRRERSIARLRDEEKVRSIVVVSHDGVHWHQQGVDTPFFFHPGLSVVRIKRLLRGDNDIMIQACQLKPGDSFLDCSLGLASDAIVASFVVGEHGEAFGVESQAMVAYIVKNGLSKVQLFPEIDQAARRIQVFEGDHIDYLRALPSKRIDIVYFDPMFREGITPSSSLNHLRSFANISPLSTLAIEEAKRVAKKRIVLKERISSGEFERLGFSIARKDRAGVAYGVLEV